MSALWGSALAWPTTWEDEMRRWFGGFSGLGAFPAMAFRTTPRAALWPPVNVWVHEHGLVVSALVPGIDPESLDVTVQEQTLKLSGERKAPEVPEGATVHRQERVYGSFVRSFRLPFPVETGGVKATYHNGLLRIELPRKEEDRPRRIKISTQGEEA